MDCFPMLAMTGYKNLKCASGTDYKAASRSFGA